MSVRQLFGHAVIEFCILGSALLIPTIVQAKQSAPPPSCATAESAPIVEIVRRSPFNGITSDDYAKANYDDYVGTIRNDNFFRYWDGTCGKYKVPVRIVVPKAEACGTGSLAHVGLIELIHPNFISDPSFPPGAFPGVMQAWNDPVYDPLMDQGYHEAWANLRVPFLFGDPGHGGSGVVYMGFQANNYNGEFDYLASLPENQGQGLRLERPQDYAILYRDVSKWLREAKTSSNFVNSGGTGFCSVNDVIGFGYSYTSTHLKAVVSDPNLLNSTWGKADPIFTRGRVMDGVLMGGFAGRPRGVSGALLANYRCPLVTASDVVPLDCSGPPAASEGPLVTVQSETDIQLGDGLRGVRAGPPGNPIEVDHYKVHEMNATSHIEAAYFPLGPLYEYFEIDPSWTRQNTIDRSPVFRADLINLVNKIRLNTPLPPSAYIATSGQGRATQYAIGIASLDPETGNGFGAISLPQAAAPLGLYRGMDCHNVISEDFDIADATHYAAPPLGTGDLNTGRAAYLLESSPKSSPGTLCLNSGGIEGLFTPYGVVDEAIGTHFCEDLYPDRQAYSDRVTAAADELVARRLLLAADRDAIIEEAEAQADLYPECVPSR